MLLTELVQYCVDQAGQFILVPDGQNIEDYLQALQFDLGRFWLMVQVELRYYQRYTPHTEQFPLTILGQSVTIAPRAPTDEDGRVPLWISSCVPTTSYLRPDVLGIVSGTMTRPASPGDFLTPYGFRLSNKRTVLWTYRKPTLYTSEPGEFDVTGQFAYLAQIEKQGNNIVEVELPELELGGGPFLDLIYAKFLERIGRSRRAFTYRDLPIETDAASMVQEGADLYKLAQENVSVQSSFWHALGV